MDPRTLVRRPKARRLTLSLLAAVMLGLLLAALAPAFGAAATPPAGAGQGPQLGARELPGLRTANTRTFANPDGTRATEVKVDAINYRTPAGAFAPIDNRFLADTAPGVAYRNAANSYRVSLPQSIAAPVRVEEDGLWMSFALEGARASQPSVAGDTARYAEAFPGVDVEYALRGGALKEDLVLAGPGSPSSFSYLLRLGPGLEAQVDPQGAVQVRDADGKSRFLLAPPALEDASGTPQGASRAVAVSLVPAGSGYRLTYAADAGWLAAPERQWPVRLDPTVIFNSYHSYQVQGGVTYDLDCYITSAFPTASPCLNATNFVSFDGTSRSRALAVFPLSTGGNSGAVIPAEAEILDAWLLMRPQTAVTAPLSVHKVTEDWNSTLATWIKRTSTHDWTTQGGDFDAIPADAQGATRPNVDCTASGSYCGWHEWSIRDAVEGWIRSASSNRGVLIKQANETTQAGLAKFDSSNGPAANTPTLWINYRPAPIGAFPTDQFVSQQLNDRMTIGVDVASGNLMVEANDLSVAGTGHDLTLSRIYNSRSIEESHNFGNRWTLNAGPDVKLIVFPGGDATFFGPSRDVANFHRLPDGTYRSPPGINAKLVSTLSGTGTLTINSTGEVYHFLNGGLTALKDRNDNDITFQYANTVAGTRLASITDTQARIFTVARDTTHRIASVTEPGTGGRDVGYAYDTAGNLKTFTDAAGKDTVYTYTSGDLTQITDPNGHRTRIAYGTVDGAKRVASITRVTNAINNTGPTTQFGYSTATRITTVTDPEGHATKYQHDASGQVLSVTDAANQSVGVTYNPNGDPLELTSATGKTTTHHYTADGLNNMDWQQLPTGARTDLSYDDLDQGNAYLPSRIAQSSGSWAAFGYDPDGNLTSVTNPLPVDNQVQLVYNADGTLASSLDAKGNTTAYGYDPQGNLTSIDHPGPLGSETLAYDAHNRLERHTDGKNQLTRYSYDPLDRPTAITYADGSTVVYEYDANGNETKRTDASGQTLFTYDPLNRLLREDLPAGSPPLGLPIPLPGGAANTYEYDRDGKLTSLTDAGGTTTYQYDALDQLAKVIEPGGHETTFGYDANGNRTATHYPNGVSVSATYDASDRLDATVAKRGTAVLASFDYGYANAAGVDTTMRTSVHDGVRGTTTTYTYDPLDRLTTAVTKDQNGTVVESYEYAYDANSNRTGETVGGVTSPGYTYNAANQLTGRTDGTSYSYDDNGNLTGSPGAMDLGYNTRDQTTSVTPAAGAAIAFSYAGPDQAERVAAGGDTFISNILGVGVQSDGQSVYYGRDSGGQLIVRRGPNGARHYYLFDGLGSIVALTDASGSVVNEYRYDPFGRAVATSETVANPWRYAGGFRDEDTGLYKMGLRYYDPAVGRWTQQDAMAGLAGAEANRYGYVGQNPVNFVDPSGTQRGYACTLVTFDPRLYRASSSVVGFASAICSPPRVYTRLRVCIQRQAFGRYFTNVSCETYVSGRREVINTVRVRARCARNRPERTYRVVASAFSIAGHPLRAGRVTNDSQARTFRC